ncbi:MAG: sterol desaturase family protein [Saprospiraceae bacterium]|nr:sterol desaturase family protein [Saprospiraceae bacterium]
MEKYIDIFLDGYGGYASYLWNDITNPTWKSYFWWLIIVSFFFLILEVIIPWRKKQVVLRKDFWLDGFYMFFNFFIFSLIIYNAASDVIVNLFNDSIIAISGFNLQASNPMNGWPLWLILVIGFFVRDFVQWWVHRLLHRSDRLWEFHKVHHSVAEMGFAAHLRYHWMENIIYRTLEYLPLALLGIGLHDFFIIHIFTLAWGHFNHSNITVSGRITGGILGALIGIVIAGGLFDVNLVLEPSIILQSTIILGLAAVSSVALGPFMRKVFNSPEMHIWHHTQDLPSERYYGVNFGLTLACWDYIFGTAYVPQEGRNNKLGFTGIDEFPKTFTGHNLNGFK